MLGALAAALAVAQTGSTEQGGQAGHAGHGRQDAASGARNRAAESGAMIGQADMRFMTKAASSGMMEVQLAEVALQKAQSDEVKQLAQTIRDDHTKANAELKAIADKRQVSLPATMEPHHKAHVDKLSALSGAAFDRAYTRDMVKEHGKDIAEFRRASKNSMDTDVRAFAEKTLPALEKHRQMAQSAAAKK